MVALSNYRTSPSLPSSSELPNISVSGGAVHESLSLTLPLSSTCRDVLLNAPGSLVFGGNGVDCKCGAAGGMEQWRRNRNR